MCMSLILACLQFTNEYSSTQVTQGTSTSLIVKILSVCAISGSLDALVSGYKMAILLDSVPKGSVATKGSFHWLVCLYSLLNGANQVPAFSCKQ